MDIDNSERSPKSLLETERVTLSLFSGAMGVIGDSLRGYIVSTRSPAVQAHIKKLEDSPHKGTFLIPIKISEGKAYALRQALLYLGQTRLLQRVEEDAEHFMQGGALYEKRIVDDYANLSRFPDQEALREAVIRIGAGFTSSLTITGDPELAEAAGNSSSREALEHAEYRGRGEGYLQVLEELQQGNQILRSHQEAEPIVARMVRAHAAKSSG